MFAVCVYERTWSGSFIKFYFSSGGAIRRLQQKGTANTSMFRRLSFAMRLLSLFRVVNIDFAGELKP